MGTIFERRGVLFIGFKRNGKRIYKNTGLAPNERRAAARVLAEVERELANERHRIAAELETVSGYFSQWTRERVRRGNRNAPADARRFVSHVLPVFGDRALVDVRPSDVRQFVATLRASTRAPRTVISTYGLLRRFFADAVADELIKTSPCALKRGDLPKKVDKDPKWRAQAVFTRDERDQMLADPRIPLDRRVCYALGFGGGLRAGEIAALRWSSVDFERKPLGSIDVIASFSRVNKAETSTKTGRPRVVPIHPGIAPILHQWRTNGFAHYFGKPPQPGDLFVPNRHAGYRTDNTFLKFLAVDLERLGMRHRRFHDTRRTFVSLARSDGAPDKFLKVISHDQQGDIVDQYSSFTWETLCDAMLHLRIEPRVPDEVLRMASGAGSEFTSTIAATEGSTMRNIENVKSEANGQEGTRSLTRASLQSVSRLNSSVSGDPSGSRNSVKTAVGSRITSTNIAAELAQAAAAFDKNGDKRALANRLRVLLAQLRGGR